MAYKAAGKVSFRRRGAGPMRGSRQKVRATRPYIRRSSTPRFGMNRPDPIPNRMFTKLRYSEVFGMAYTAGGAPANYQWAINSIHDPNQTGTGHQPLGHDQWALLYANYRVHGVKYTITMTNIGLDQLEVAVQIRPNTDTSAVMDTIRESPTTVWKGILGGEQSASGTQVARGYCSIAKARGVSSTVVKAENDYQAAFGANPVALPLLNIWMSNQDASTSATIRVRVDFEFLVEFNNRKQLTQS